MNFSSASNTSIVKPTAALRTRVKMCGITNLHDAQDAVAAGADALGFIFYEKSPRMISIENAAAISAQLPPFVTRVGLFVNSEASTISAALKTAQLDILQFHGDESAAFAEQFQRPYYPVVRMQVANSGVATEGGVSKQLEEKIAEHRKASGFLFDTFDGGHQGGTGKTFDWSLFESSVRGAMLAGGLHAGNVSQAIAQVRPYAVDVCTGVESSPGKKCVNKMRDFVLACRQADDLSEKQK